jgi:hypothetical protein
LGLPPNEGKNLKVNFDAIQKMHFSDFNRGVSGGATTNAATDDEFKPSDIIDEDDLGNDDSDDEILKKFRGPEDQLKREQ